MAEPGGEAQTKEELEAFAASLRRFVSFRSCSAQARQVPFPVLQSAILAALLNELAIVVASAPAAGHRDQIACLNRGLERLVREHSISMARQFGPTEPEPGYSEPGA